VTIRTSEPHPLRSREVGAARDAVLLLLVAMLALSVRVDLRAARNRAPEARAATQAGRTAPPGVFPSTHASPVRPVPAGLAPPAFGDPHTEGADPCPLRDHEVRVLVDAGGVARVLRLTRDRPSLRG